MHCLSLAKKNRSNSTFEEEEKKTHIENEKSAKHLLLIISASQLLIMKHTMYFTSLLFLRYCFLQLNCYVQTQHLTIATAKYNRKRAYVQGKSSTMNFHSCLQQKQKKSEM